MKTHIIFTSLVFLQMLLLLFSSSAATAQDSNWQLTDGPYGGSVLAVTATTAGQLYAATLGGSIFRSSDEGLHWDRLSEGPDSLAGIIYGSLPDIEAQSIEEIVVDPEGNIFAAGPGLYCSKDGGAGWQYLNQGINGFQIEQLEVNKAGELFAITWDKKLYKSADKGQTWEGFGLPLKDVLVVKVLSDTTLLAGTQDGIFISPMANPDWAEFEQSDPLPGVYEMVVLEGSVYVISELVALYGFTNDGIRFPDPLFTDPSRISDLAAIDSNKLAVSTASGIYSITRTSAANWESEHLAFTGSGAKVLYAEPGHQLIAGVDDEGLYFSLDGGLNWENRIEGMNGHLVIQLIPLGATKIVAKTSLGKLFQLETGGAGWQAVADFGYRVNSLLESKDGELFAGTQEDGLFRSSDGGENWEKVDLGQSVSLVSQVAESPNGYLFAAAGAYIYRSMDKGASWQLLEWNFGFFTLNRLTISPQGNLFASTSSGSFLSKDNAETWAFIPFDINSSNTSAISINDEDHLFLFTKGLYRSTDLGQSWQLLGFTDQQVGPIAFDKSGKVFITAYAGRGIGYVSEDNGETWSVFDSTLSIIIPDLHVSSDNILYAATYRRGIYYRNLEETTKVHSPASVPDFNLQQNFPNPFSGQTTISFRLLESAEVRLKVTDIQGKHVTTLIDARLPPGDHRVIFQPQGRSRGIYCYSLQVDGIAQTKRMVFLGD